MTILYSRWSLEFQFWGILHSNISQDKKTGDQEDGLQARRTPYRDKTTNAPHCLSIFSSKPRIFGPSAFACRSVWLYLLLEQTLRMQLHWSYEFMPQIHVVWASLTGPATGSIGFVNLIWYVNGGDKPFLVKKDTRNAAKSEARLVLIFGRFWSTWRGIIVDCRQSSMLKKCGMLTRLGDCLDALAELQYSITSVA